MRNQQVVCPSLFCCKTRTFVVLLVISVDTFHGAIVILSCLTYEIKKNQEFPQVLQDRGGVQNVPQKYLPMYVVTIVFLFCHFHSQQHYFMIKEINECLCYLEVYHSETHRSSFFTWVTQNSFVVREANYSVISSAYPQFCIQN